jgi:glyoxylase-like metal-dependent hydrolase (beta-lactamase superfamily II)
MAAYLHSLELLKGYRPRAIAPGHGRVLADPVRVIDGIVAHRGRRESKVLDVLRAVGCGQIDYLLPKVYDDVRAELLPIARYSLEAHLIKLEREGRACYEHGGWALDDAARDRRDAQPVRAEERRAGKQAGEE